MIPSHGIRPIRLEASEGMMDRPSESHHVDPKVRELFDRAYGIYRTDPDAAIPILREAVSLGCTDSMVFLGDILIDILEDGCRKEAMDLFMQAHLSGNNMGSRNLGYCYAVGIGTEVDKAKAAEWYRISGNDGNAKAQCNLGVLYEYGHGVPKDFRMAAEWYRMSAENGCSRGMTNYARMLRDGMGVAKDPESAAEWFERSGSPRAKRLLAQMYLSGKDIERNTDAAIELLESASEKDRKAMYILGDLIFETDRCRAMELFRTSASKGYDEAIERLRSLGEDVPERRTKRRK
ncbi:MAG: tetratricopeptide repeat protein [Candidatus Methanomethylophilaceae archaeon]